jgi:hypothetical protein
MADFKLDHAREFTDLEAGPEAGAVGFWFRAVNLGDRQLAVDVWDAIIFAEHFLSLLDNDPSKRSPEELATLADLVGKANAVKARVVAAESARHNVPVVPSHEPHDN